MVMWRGGSCAAGRREPCQAGNRAALSGLHCAPQSACPPHDQDKGSFLFLSKSIFKGRSVMYRVLYRKWRPQTFEEVYGQPHITATLKNELVSGRVAHAYLFTARAERARPPVRRFFQRRSTVSRRMTATPATSARYAAASTTARCSMLLR